MSKNYDSELTATREETAAVLSGVADGLLAGAVRLGDDEDAVVVAVPDHLDLEIELEAEDDGMSLELEMRWPHPEGGDADAAVPSAADSPIADDDIDDSPIADEELPVPAGAADASGSLARFEVFRDRAEEWRWRLRHRNGNIIATGGEGYTRKHNALKGLRSVVRNAPGAELTDADGT